MSNFHHKCNKIKLLLIGPNSIFTKTAHRLFSSEAKIDQNEQTFRAGCCDETPIVVTFTGGLGAQIFSAAIYFYLKNSGKIVFADMSYFHTPFALAMEGEKGTCTHWAWELDCFGMSLNSFPRFPPEQSGLYFLHDGPEKSSLMLEVFSDPKIADHFPTPEVKMPFDFGNEKYLCVHLRRGDYLNVASYMVSDKNFLEVIKPFSYIYNKIVIVSDSLAKDDFVAELSNLFETVLNLDRIGLVTAHIVMRCASTLICSNSQFSLSAALLNGGRLKIVPKQWYGGDDEIFESSLHDKCSFQILQ